MKPGRTADQNHMPAPVDRQKFAKQNEKYRADRGPMKLQHAADDDHGEEFARKGDRYLDRPRSARFCREATCRQVRSTSPRETKATSSEPVGNLAESARALLPREWRPTRCRAANCESARGRRRWRRRRSQRRTASFPACAAIGRRLILPIPFSPLVTSGPAKAAICGQRRACQRARSARNRRRRHGSGPRAREGRTPRRDPPAEAARKGRAPCATSWTTQAAAADVGRSEPGSANDTQRPVVPTTMFQRHAGDGVDDDLRRRCRRRPSAPSVAGSTTSTIATAGVAGNEASQRIHARRPMLEAGVRARPGGRADAPAGRSASADNMAAVDPAGICRRRSCNAPEADEQGGDDDAPEGSRGRR